MSWITVVWSMNAAACLTLAGIYLLVWCKQRVSWVYLVFSCSAMAAAAIAMIELALMRADGTVEYGVIMRWAQLPVWVLIVSLVVFVRLYLHTGRPWLAWSVCGLRTLALILNFVFTPNLSYRSITSLRHLSWWGETVSVPVGVVNPWTLVSHLSLVLLVIFFVDATITAWRRGDRQRALVAGGSLIFFTAVAVGQIVLVVWGFVETPFLACFPYLGIVAATAYELSSDMLRAAQLTHKLQMSEAALHDTEGHMELAANAAGIGMWTWDIARDEIWMTKQGRALLGFSESEKLDTERVRSVVHPDDHELVRQTVERSFKSGAESEAEYRIVLPDGQIRWVTRRGRVQFDRDGKPARMRGVWFDITERRSSEEHFRRVVEAAPNAIIMLDNEGRITLVNVQAEEIFGYTREELIGHPIKMLVPERLRFPQDWYRHGYFADSRARLLGAGRELLGQRKDGSKVPVEIGLNPIHTSKGLFLLASIVDISERKLAELEMARQRNALAHLSRVTTLGELSGSLAHELNQPLTAILSNAQAAQRFLANDDVDLNELREILNDIVAEDRRAGEIIRRLHVLFKKKEMPKHSDDIDINEVVQDVLKLMRTDLMNQNVTVNTELARNLPAVTGDQIQLQQVLLNLVLNACEAMTDCDSSECRLLIASKLENGSAVRVSVTDRGGSIPEEKLEHVFEPFFTTKATGMGLGLSVCQTIIKAHRGKLWATNNADRGATFHFSLPVVFAPETPNY